MHRAVHDIQKTGRTKHRTFPINLWFIDDKKTNLSTAYHYFVWVCRFFSFSFLIGSRWISTWIWLMERQRYFYCKCREAHNEQRSCTADSLFAGHCTRRKLKEITILSHVRQQYGKASISLLLRWLWLLRRNTFLVRFLSIRLNSKADFGRLRRYELAAGDGGDRLAHSWPQNGKEIRICRSYHSVRTR